MYGKDYLDAMEARREVAKTYRISAIYGSVEVLPGPPGFIRTVKRDESGRIISDTMDHLLCMSLGDGTCVYCGRDMKVGTGMQEKS